MSVQRRDIRKIRALPGTVGATGPGNKSRKLTMADVSKVHSFLVIFLVVCSVPLSLANLPVTIQVSRNWIVPEDLSVGSRVAQAEVSSGDVRDIRYHIYASDHMDISEYFHINPHTGEIQLAKPLKGKTGSGYLKVKAEPEKEGVIGASIEVQVRIQRPRTGLPPGTHFPNQHPLMNNPFVPNMLFPPSGVFPPVPANPAAPSVPAYPNFPVSVGVTPPNYSIATSPSSPSPPTQVPSGPLTSRPHQLPSTVNTTSSTTSPPPTPIDNDLDSGPSKVEPEETVNGNALEKKHNPSVESNSSANTIALATALPIVAVIIIAIVATLMWLFKRRSKLTKRPTKELRKESAVTTSSNMTFSSGEATSPTALTQWAGKRAASNRYESWDTDPTAPQQLSAENKWEFPRHHLQIGGILGEGCFGQVWRCEALNIDGKEGTTTVAVKTLKESAGERERSDLISELSVMKMLDAHPNVVRLLGCCTEKDPLFVIMEYVAMGKLQSFLRNSRAQHDYGNLHGDSDSLSSKDLTSFALQVARGMEYLASKGIIHRDLAARNILIDKERVCKVADFGFARDVIANHVYERKSDGRLPIRWMAPEALYDNIFTTKTDVWSFGVLMWEIVTLGSTPYPGMAAGEVMRKVRDGYRLEKPEHCRRELYNIMFYCWAHNPDDRPSFAELVNFLRHLLFSETDYIELDRFPDHDYYNMPSLSGEKL